MDACFSDLPIYRPFLENGTEKYTAGPFATSDMLAVFYLCRQYPKDDCHMHNRLATEAKASDIIHSAAKSSCVFGRCNQMLQRIFPVSEVHWGRAFAFLELQNCPCKLRDVASRAGNARERSERGRHGPWGEEERTATSTLAPENSLLKLGL